MTFLCEKLILLKYLSIFSSENALLVPHFLYVLFLWVNFGKLHLNLPDKLCDVTVKKRTFLFLVWFSFVFFLKSLSGTFTFYILQA